jgi:UMF1 family MFS transporter
LFFREYWSADQHSASTTLQLGAANSAATVVVAVLAPLLGAIADRSAAKKRWLAATTALAVTMTAVLPLAAQGDWLMALLVYSLALIGFSAANVFYDAMLVDVAPEQRFHSVSALGFGLGYLGGGLLFAFNVAMTLWPQRFGLESSAQAVRVSFLIVAAWWAFFSVPLLIYVRECKAFPTQGFIRAGLRQLVDTVRHLREKRAVWLFLLAYWCYIDGVHTIARMAVDYGMALGFDARNLIVALLVTQFVGFPAALAFGYVGRRIGARPALFAGIAAYGIATAWSYFMTEVWEFYALAVAVGLVQGGVQSLSRSMYACLIPASQAGEFFGFYNMLGRFAAVVGPLLVGILGAATGSPRVGILSILLLLLIGAALLFFVREPPVEPSR